MARTVLMYHAVNGPGARLGASDPAYTVEAGQLVAHLRVLLDAGVTVDCARDGLQRRDGAPVMIGFDDGHITHYTHAMPVLVEHGVRADFFVNPGLVGQDGLADWKQLRAMARAGMSIQSHGWTHTYFTRLGREQLLRELIASRRRIEDAIGEPVTLLAPPGGRSPAGLAALAREAGYRHVLGSRPGRLRGDPGGVVPRVAVGPGTSPAQLLAWGRGDRVPELRARLRHGVLQGAKRVLGDERYERVRARLLGLQEVPGT
ncbi:MAG: polysaccharide deacetylase family protein [Lysobacteraceae bacterium]